MSMFFRSRATQAEYFDAPGRPQAEIAEGYQSLAWVNRLCIFADPFQRLLPKLLGRDNCKSLSILDLGAGDGSLGIVLTDWARTKRDWDWRFTNLDTNASALRLNPGVRNVVGSALALPFRDASFDVVIASQMTHHLSNEEVVVHLREAWRVTRRGLFLSDLHRGPALYSFIWLLFQVRRFPKHFQADGLLSVRRGFRIGELRSLAHQAGIPDARVWLYYGSRVILEATKTP
jgi:2-polyprenyl-3-methyl-5-hydroxy-6-metoxy-1,4-benzoquinol methylase